MIVLQRDRSGQTCAVVGGVADNLSATPPIRFKVDN